MSTEANEAAKELALLHEEIDRCTLCREVVVGFQKPPTMSRGQPGKIMIVGISPGNRELQTAKAFSGASGKRLNEWLIKAGAQSANPRIGIYFTSVLKCQEPNRMYPLMVHRCRKFLNHQIQIIRPELIITLGRQPYEELHIIDIPYSDALCQFQSTKGQLFTTQFNYHYALIPWPHPSGRNRNLNDPDIQIKLHASFEVLRPYLMQQ